MRLLGGLVVIGVVSGELGVCDNERRIQLLLVHDASANYRSLFGSVSKNAQKFMDRLAEEWGPNGIEMGVSSFVDKPMPFRGWGDCCGVGEMDYCYMHMTGPTSDVSAIKTAFSEMEYYVGSGGDYPENPYEGMIGSLRDCRNRMEEPGFALDGKEVFRVMIMVTDEIAQPGGSGQNEITKWNAKPDPTTQMGFWHANFPSLGALYSRDSGHNVTLEYAELLSLRAKGDDSMTADEKKRYKSLYEWWGPDTFPELITPHPGTTAAAESCTKYVYPTEQQVVEALIEQQVTPMFLIGVSQKITNQVKTACTALGHDIGSDKKKYQQCLKDYYPTKLKDAGYTGEDMVAFAFDGEPRSWEPLAEAILEVLSTYSKPIPCDPLTEDITADETKPETITTVTVSSTVDPTPVDPTVSGPVIGWPSLPSMPTISLTTTSNGEAVNPTLSEGQDTTTLPIGVVTTTTTGEVVPPTTTGEVVPPTTTGGVVPPTTTGGVVPPTGTGEVVTTTTTQGGVVTTTTQGGVVTTAPGGVVTTTTKSGGNGGSTTTTTTTEEEGGSNIGVIAGATGGALAALAAVGLLAYKKLGGALMGGGGHPSLAQDTEQVEVDESPVERETLEEVTMDMFQ